MGERRLRVRLLCKLAELLDSSEALIGRSLSGLSEEREKIC